MKEKEQDREIKVQDLDDGVLVIWRMKGLGQTREIQRTGQEIKDLVEMLQAKGDKDRVELTVERGVIIARVIPVQHPIKPRK